MIPKPAPREIPIVVECDRRADMNTRFTAEVLCDIAEAANNGHFEAAARIATAAALGEYENWDVRASCVDTTPDDEVL